LMVMIGHPQMIEMPAFKLNKDRVTNRPQIDALINAWLKTRSTEEVLRACEEAEVPVAKIQSIADLMNHPQVIARGNFVEVPDHDRGDVCITSPVPRLSRRPGSIRWAGQRLGESTQDVLQSELQITDDEWTDLRQRGIVGG